MSTITEPTTAIDPFDLMPPADRRHYLAGAPKLQPCPWCGGRARHNPVCVALLPDWLVTMPFGKHKGKPVRDVPHDYLQWLLASGMSIDADVRTEAHDVLGLPAPTLHPTD